jgi:hypothetical protein
MTLVKFNAGSSFIYYDTFYVIDDGYIVVDTFIQEIDKFSKNLRVTALDWVLDRCDTIPIKNFVNKQYCYRDLYRLQKQQNSTSFFEYRSWVRDVIMINYEECYKLVKWKGKDEREENAKDDEMYTIHINEVKTK